MERLEPQLKWRCLCSSFVLHCYSVCLFVTYLFSVLQYACRVSRRFM